MKRHTGKRILAFSLCCLFALGLFLTAALILKHADHDCVGHDCMVCAQLHAAQKLLKQLSLAAWGGVAYAGLGLALACFRGKRTGAILFLTPVAQKVRMNH